MYVLSLWMHPDLQRERDEAPVGANLLARVAVNDAAA
jgi:hypothetical protein